MHLGRSGSACTEHRCWNRSRCWAPRRHRWPEPWRGCTSGRRASRWRCTTVCWSISATPRAHTPSGSRSRASSPTRAPPAPPTSTCACPNGRPRASPARALRKRAPPARSRRARPNPGRAAELAAGLTAALGPVVAGGRVPEPLGSLERAVGSGVGHGERRTAPGGEAEATTRTAPEASTSAPAPGG